MKYDKTHEKELKDKIIEASIQEQIQMIVEKHVDLHNQISIIESL